MHDSIGSPKMTDLVRQHHKLLYRYAYRLSGSAIDAEDLTQEVYLLACRHLDQLREPGRAKAWLCTILRNAYLKKIRSRDEIKFSSPSMETVPAPTTETQMTLGIDSEQLQQALGELPELFRSPVILHYFEEFSYKEIAEQMDVPIGTIMSRLARAKNHLRRSLSESSHGKTPSNKTPSSGRYFAAGSN